MSTRAIISVLVCVLAISLATGAHAAEPIRAVRGLASHVDVEYASRLRSRADQSPTSNVLVRVSQLSDSASGSGPRQRIEFIVAVAGSFDLRDFIEREDGRAITELAALPIIVGSQLPADAGTDLYSSGSPWFNWAAHYRVLLWIAVAMWIAVPVIYFVVRSLRKPPALVPDAPAAPPPTTEGQLIEAIRSSANRPLTTEERGQLELLVFRYFSGTTGHSSATDIDIAKTFRRIRESTETRPVITALERWLHARDGEQTRAAAVAALDELRQSRLTVAHPIPVAKGATA